MKLIITMPADGDCNPSCSMPITLDVGCANVIVEDCFCGVGINTPNGHFGIAQRDNGIEVLHNSKMVWSSNDLFPGCDCDCDCGEYCSGCHCVGKTNDGPTELSADEFARQLEDAALKDPPIRIEERKDKVVTKKMALEIAARIWTDQDFSHVTMNESLAIKIATLLHMEANGRKFMEDWSVTFSRSEGSDEPEPVSFDKKKTFFEALPVNTMFAKLNDGEEQGSGFPFALTSVLAGSSIFRSSWRNERAGERIFYVSDDAAKELEIPSGIYLGHPSDDKLLRWSPRQDDMLSNDWRVTCDGCDEWRKARGL